MINLQDFVAGNPRLFKQFKINELLFVEYLCLAEDTLSEIWSHTNYFVYCLGGQKKWQTPRGEYLVRSGEVIFVKKGATAVYQYFEEKFMVLLIFVPDDFIKTVMDKYELRSAASKNQHEDAVIPIPADATLTSYFESVLSYFLKPSAPSPALLNIKFEELIVSLLSDNRHPALTAYFQSVCNHERIAIADVMENNFSHALTLKELARLSARSLSAFKREFMQLYGIPPGKWLTERRLEYSKYLLQTGDKTIDSIIFECGFKNRSHFIRAFKEKTGVTPVKYRQAFQHSTSLLTAV